MKFAAFKKAQSAINWLESLGVSVDSMAVTAAGQVTISVCAAEAQAKLSADTTVPVALNGLPFLEHRVAARGCLIFWLTPQKPAAAHPQRKAVH